MGPDDAVPLKGQSNENFYLQFFRKSNPPGPLASYQRVKMFSILVNNWPSFSSIKFKNLTPRGIRPGEVKLLINLRNPNLNRKYFKPFIL